MTTSSAPEVIAKIIALLDPLQVEQRQKVMNSVRAYFGDAIAAAPLPGAQGVGGAGASSSLTPSPASLGSADGAGSLPGKATAWLRSNGMSMEQLLDVFHIDGDTIDLIAEVPGKSKKEKTYNVYVLMGVASLLSCGVPRFEDDAARAMCEGAGCYDAPNHSAYMKEVGNVLSGDKKSGWMLTQPGLKRAAVLVSEILTPSK